MTNPPTAKKSQGAFYTLQLAIGVALALATLFVFWLPTAAPPGSTAASTPLPAALANPGQPTLTPNPSLRIGIVAGHWSKDPDKYDPGAVCDDSGVKEVDVNLAIATKVRDLLVAEGYSVEMLEEFDPRLEGYTAVALVSIHADSCVYVDDNAKGFKVSPPASNPRPENSNRLVSCIIARYASETGMPQHRGSITYDMTEYHAFGEINPETPAAIIETGFLRLDFQRLTQDQDTLARGIANGLFCFLRNESTTLQPIATP